MGYHINLLKNKFRRFKIEIHHSKNKISSREHIIKKRDLTKPLITLRTVEPSKANDEPIEIEQTEASLAQDGDDFLDFSDGVITQDNDNTDHTTALGSTVRSYISAYKKVKSGKSSLQLEIKRQQCRCTCHQDAEVNLRSPFFHNQHCLSFCDMSNYAPQCVTEVVGNVVDHVNYIEPKPKSHHRLWFFRKRHSLAKIPEPQNRTDEATSDAESIISAADRIEIIAQSTAGIEQSSIFGKNEIQLTNKSTSYSRKKGKSGTSLIDFSRSNSGCGTSPASRQNNSNEPWRMVMNDISLYAALLSTGSRPVLSKSTLNLVADFTSSKHDPNQRSFSNSCHSELISFRSIPPVQLEPSLPLYQLHNQPTINNENLVQNSIFNDENNGLDLTLTNEATRKISSHQFLDSRPVTHKSRLSVSSDPLEKDTFMAAETSAVYGEVFQDYNYNSDESIERWKELDRNSRVNLAKKEERDQVLSNISNEFLPLNITNRGLNRIF